MKNIDMKKFIFVISSKITTDGDVSDIELTTTGNFSRLNGKWVLIYDELAEDKITKINTVIKIADQSLSITRNGDASRLQMTVNQRNMCHYRTEFGDIVMGVYCTEIKSDLTETGGRVHMSYTLDVNAAILSENEVTIKIREV